VEKCTDYKVQNVRPTVKPKKTWSKVVGKYCWSQQLNKEDATNHSK